MPNAAPRGQFESASVARATGFVAAALRAVSSGAVSLRADDFSFGLLSGGVAYRSVTTRHSGPSYHLRADWVSIPNLTPDPQGELDVIAGGSLTPVTPPVTFFMGMFGDVTESLVAIPMPACTIVELRCRATSAPGTGKSFTYTLRKNSADQTGLEAVLSDSSVESSDTGSVAFAAGDKLSVKLVATSGAAEAYHLWSIKLQLAS